MVRSTSARGTESQETPRLVLQSLLKNQGSFGETEQQVLIGIKTIKFDGYKHMCLAL